MAIKSFTILRHVIVVLVHLTREDGQRDLWSPRDRSRVTNTNAGINYLEYIMYYDLYTQEISREKGLNYSATLHTAASQTYGGARAETRLCVEIEDEPGVV